MLTRTRPWRADLARSVRLLREFRHEQSDPARFYTALARDSTLQVSQYHDLSGQLMLDVGGGPGYFRQAFEAAGASYVALDADVGELSGTGSIDVRTVLGSGMQLPFRDAAVDVCYSSNVLEHVEEPWRMAAEMLRVTRPGGLVFISYTTWWGPCHGTTWVGVRPGGGTPGATVTSPRTSSVSPSSPSRSPMACAGRAASRMPTWCTCCRATTRGGVAGCCVSR